MRDFVKVIKKEYKTVWVRLDFIMVDKEFRRIRRCHKYRMASCIKCGHRFKDGEYMSLGCFEKRGNKALCRTCAEFLLEDDNSPQWSESEIKIFSGQQPADINQIKKEK